MTTGLLRISVVGGDQRVDLAVPPALPVAELVPGLAHRLGVVSDAGLWLCTVTGSPLDDSVGLAAQGVRDGAVLALAEPPPAPVVHDDPVEAAATGPPDHQPRWLPAAGAAVLLLLGALASASADAPRAAAVLALLLLAGALLLGRSAPEHAFLAATASCAEAAVGAGGLAAGLRGGAGVAWAASGGAVLAAAALAVVGLPSHRLWMLPVLVVGASAAAVGAVLTVRRTPWPSLACALLVLVVLGSAAVPWLAAGRIVRPSGRVDPEVVAAQARVARELMAGLTVGLGVVHVLLVPVVTGQGLAGVGLAASASALVLVRSRHHAAPAQALPGLATGAVGLLATACTALWLHDGWRPYGALVLTAAGAALLAQARVSRPPLGGRDTRGSAALARLALHVLEVALAAALLPLLLLATGATEALA